VEGDLGVTGSLREVPELGPLLGRFADSAPRGPAGFPLDDLRFQLLSGLYQRFGDARRALAAGNAAEAGARISRSTWLELWREASSAATDRLLAEIDRRFEAAGLESRMPPKRLLPLKPTEADRATIRARLDAAGIPLERIESPETSEALTTGLLHAAMALDSSWERLGSAAVSELLSWDREIARVRTWRRSTTTLWLITGLAIIATLALGLSLGGYLPAPGPIGVLQRWFWSLPWR
jgi:hypothetical protein